MLLVFSTSKACNVPVFRYALERWPADTFHVVVYTQGAEDNALLSLKSNAVEKDSLCNYSVDVVDANTSNGQKLAEANGITQFPWAAVYYPTNARVRGLVWQGPLNAANARRLINSPVRSALVEKLLGGEAAVWLFLKSGDPEKDKPALETLQKTLERASNELKIPSTGVDINGNAIEVTDFVDYDVHFDVLQVSRDDPKEVILKSMLLGSESDLSYYNDPMAFPVFGRGRLLYAVIGKGIREKTVYDACRSITAWCSCEIKAQNPGIDLLLSTDWSAPVGGHMVKDEETPLLTGLSEFIPPQNDAQKTDNTKLAADINTEPIEIDSMNVSSIKKDTVRVFSEEDDIQKSSNTLLRNLLLLTGFGIVVVFAATFFIKSKKTK